MRRKNVPREFLEVMSVENAKAVKAALDRNRLSQKWLLWRLDQDWGLKLKPSELSELLYGKRPVGPKMQRVLWCAEQIITEYESFYKERRRGQ